MLEFAFIAFAFALGSGVLGAQQPPLLTPPRGRPTPTAPASPRMVELLERLRHGDSTALPTFWERAASERTPIIEPIPGDSARVLATFVYRDAQPLTNVVISGGVAASAGS